MKKGFEVKYSCHIFSVVNFINYLLHVYYLIGNPTIKNLANAYSNKPSYEVLLKLRIISSSKLQLGVV